MKLPLSCDTLPPLAPGFLPLTEVARYSKIRHTRSLLKQHRGENMTKRFTSTLTKSLIAASLIALFGISISHASTSYVSLNNYPANGKCEAGKNYDDGEFVYFCNKGCLEATYCIALDEDKGGDMALEVDERITFDVSTTLRCEQDASSNRLYQVLEDVSSETLATSKGGFCPK